MSNFYYILFRDIRIKYCNRLSNMDADVVAKKVYL